VKFHDGSNLTYIDVLHSLGLAKSNPYYVHVFKYISSFEERSGNIVIYLNSNVPNFVSLLEIPIVKSGQDKIGTGCYRITDASSNNFFSLVSFENYWGDNSPNIKQIQVDYMPDANTFFFSYNAGEIHAISVEVDDLGKYTNSNNNYVLVPTNYFTFLGFNNQRSTFSKELKNACFYGLDKEKLNSSVFSGKVDVTNSFLNPGRAFSTGFLSQYNFDFAFNSLKAYSGKKSFEILVNIDNPKNVDVAYYISNNLKSVGLTIPINRVSFENLNKLVNEGNFDAFIGDILLPNNCSFDVLSKKVNYESDKMDEIFKSWKEQTTNVGIESGYHFVEEQYLQDMPFISLYFKTKTMLYSEKIISTKGKFAPYPNNPYADIVFWKFK
jgi:peptide/nickel transport system substrate-binding protein